MSNGNKTRPHTNRKISLETIKRWTVCHDHHFLPVSCDKKVEVSRAVVVTALFCLPGLIWMYVMPKLIWMYINSSLYHMEVNKGSFAGR